MTNDTEIFDAMHLDRRTDAFGPQERARTGTPDAIHRDGYTIDPLSRSYCPHEWINEHGYVDLQLVLNHADFE
jgi:hypothetical protein